LLGQPSSRSPEVEQLQVVDAAHLGRRLSWTAGGDHRLRVVTGIAGFRPRSPTPRRPVRHHAHVPGQLPLLWAASGGYDFVPRRCSPRWTWTASSWSTTTSGPALRPLRFVPPGKAVVLGLVTTKRGELEDKEDLIRRIDEASRYVPLDQLCLSPQCGFSPPSTATR